MRRLFIPTIVHGDYHPPISVHPLPEHGLLSHGRVHRHTLCSTASTIQEEQYLDHRSRGDPGVVLLLRRRDWIDHRLWARHPERAWHLRSRPCADNPDLAQRSS